MKKSLFILGFLVLTSFTVIGCKKKKTQLPNAAAISTTQTNTKQTEVQDQSQSQTQVQTQVAQNQVSASNLDSIDLGSLNLDNISLEDLDSTNKGSTKVSASDYSNINFEPEENIFKISKLNIKSKKNNTGVIVLTTYATGAISGWDGSFTIELPFTLNWKVGDKAWVEYKKGYNFDTEEDIITDIQFIEKTEEAVKSRKKERVTMSTESEVIENSEKDSNDNKTKIEKGAN